MYRWMHFEHRLPANSQSHIQRRRGWTTLWELLIDVVYFTWFIRQTWKTEICLEECHVHVRRMIAVRNLLLYAIRDAYSLRYRKGPLESLVWRTISINTKLSTAHCVLWTKQKRVPVGGVFGVKLAEDKCQRPSKPASKIVAHTSAKPSWCLVTKTKYLAPASLNKSVHSSGFQTEAVKFAMKSS